MRRRHLGKPGQRVSTWPGRQTGSRQNGSRQTDRLPGTQTPGQPWASGHPAGWPA